VRPALWPLPRARAIVLATAAMSDVCLPSLEDARALLGLEEPDAIADALLGRGAGLVALKLGPAGVLVAHAGGRERIPGRRVTPIDATGAGDTFDGAFLTQWLRTNDAVGAARYANAAAALSTLGRGAVGPIPRRAEVEAALTSDP
jgi:2-dehydro-3-deoxygluconokinase